MRNIVLVGGMGTGKTTLAERLAEFDSSIFHLSGSKYGVKIPMTLGINPNQVSKSDYIKIIMQNDDIKLREDLTRDMTDAYASKLNEIYGKTFFGELYDEIISRKGTIGVIDNCPKSSNIAYLKNNGFYVVGLVSDYETQVERCMKRKKGIDPTTEPEMRTQISNTANFFELEKSMSLAHDTFDMNKFDIVNNSSDIEYIVSQVIKQVR